MEFLRFGSTIPGTYWGCCAVDIIQNFKIDPSTKTSIQLVGGDGGNPVMLDGGNAIAFAGPTYKDVFNQRIRFGTFDRRDMPNHGFLAILTSDQIKSTIGLKWLKILRETGFEFIRSVSNSVYQGQGLSQPSGTGSSMNHIFGLFRNIGQGASGNPLVPPSAWTSLPKVVDEAWEMIPSLGIAAFVSKQNEDQTKIWNDIGPAKLLTEAQVIKAGAPVVLAGLRSKFPQQDKKLRKAIQSVDKPDDKPIVKSDPFSNSVKIEPVKAAPSGFNCGLTNCKACQTGTFAPEYDGVSILNYNA